MRNPMLVTTMMWFGPTAALVSGGIKRVPNSGSPASASGPRKFTIGLVTTLVWALGPEGYLKLLMPGSVNGPFFLGSGSGLTRSLFCKFFYLFTRFWLSFSVFLTVGTSVC